MRLKLIGDSFTVMEVSTGRASQTGQSGPTGKEQEVPVTFQMTFIALYQSKKSVDEMTAGGLRLPSILKWNGDPGYPEHATSVSCIN